MVPIKQQSSAFPPDERIAAAVGEEVLLELGKFFFAKRLNEVSEFRVNGDLGGGASSRLAMPPPAGSGAAGEGKAKRAASSEGVQSPWTGPSGPLGFFIGINLRAGLRLASPRPALCAGEALPFLV